MYFDTIIIGSGFAGLYYAYKTKITNFKILEKNDRIGGRVYNIDWNNNHISLGGGAIKFDNEITINLSTEFNLELGDSINKYHMIDLESKTENINKPNENNFYESNKIITKYLKKLYNKNIDEIKLKKLNWDEFISLYLDYNTYQAIKSNLLYKTYLNADIESVLKNEIPELLRTEDFKIKFIKNKGYTELLNKLIDNINQENIQLNTTVVEINKNNQLFQIKTNSGIIFECNNLVIATESSPKIKYNLDQEILLDIDNLYKMVDGSNYLRVYSYHTLGHGLECSFRTSFLPGKVIIINKNILMCCYTEAEDSLKLLQILEKNDKITQINIIHKLLKNCNINITKPDDIIYKFWNSGVHYNTINYNLDEKKNILKRLKNKNIYIIGECIADSHGWVNSALESVDYILQN